MVSEMSNKKWQIFFEVSELRAEIMELMALSIYLYEIEVLITNCNRIANSRKLQK